MRYQTRGFLAITALIAALWAPHTAVAQTDGTFLEVFDGNGPFPNPFRDSPALYKCDEIKDDDQTQGDAACGKNEDGSVAGENYADGDFTIVFDDANSDEATSGSWSFSPNNNESKVPTFLLLKAGRKYAAYDIAGLTSGDWATNKLGNKGISHLSFFNGNDGDTSIPVPATLGLLGAGLIGLGLLARRGRART